VEVGRAADTVDVGVQRLAGIVDVVARRLAGMVDEDDAIEVTFLSATIELM
jgi:hypothetical protein